MTSPNIKTLSHDQLRRICDPAIFDFKSTESLPTLDEVIGQDRAVQAVSFGIEIGSPGYHMYALGPAGTGKSTTIKSFLERRASDQPVPDDWAYVNNFGDPDKPQVLQMPAGIGCKFEEDMDQFVEELKNEVPQAFETEEYAQEQENVQEKFQKKRQKLLQALEQKAQSKEFTLIQTPHGIVIAPVVKGEVVTPDQFGKLEESKRKELEESQAELQDELRDTVRRIQQLQEESKEELRELDQKVIGFSVEHLINKLRERYEEQTNILSFLDQVREDILENVQAFKQLQQGEQDGQQILPFQMMAQQQQQPTFDKYRVNLIVDNCDSEGAPVLLASNPTYYNLVGRVDHQAQFGALVTNFRMIKSGALHMANGGYLMVEVRDLLTKPFAWDALKRALKNKEIRIEPMAEDYRLVTTRTLEPQPIPLNIKVILIGDPMLYYLLYNLDEDFQEMFKVKADFNVQMDWDPETPQKYAQFIGSLCKEEDLIHFAPSGVAKIVEHSARMVSHKHKLATRFGDIVDLVRQSSYWAGKNGNNLVQAQDVQRAIDEKIYRSNRLEKNLQEMIEEETILIDTQGEVVGQVNGLSVLPLGDYMFGKPTRITARTHVGNAGVVNIDRETELGGPIHNKGVMILAGYLGGKFAQDQPLTLSASLTFEQSYQGVEGDSASSTELYALLSSLSGYSIRQNFAITGSVNQRGQVQAIGGVNEKIEGFFDICAQNGLTGDQGVLIPESNVKNLMLREDVVEAVKNGKFHVYPISTIDQGIALLTGIEAGERQEDGSYAEGTVNWAVQNRLRDLAEKAKEFSSRSEKRN